MYRSQHYLHDKSATRAGFHVNKETLCLQETGTGNDSARRRLLRLPRPDRMTRAQRGAWRDQGGSMFFSDVLERDPFEERFGP